MVTFDVSHFQCRCSTTPAATECDLPASGARIGMTGAVTGSATTLLYISFLRGGATGPLPKGVAVPVPNLAGPAAALAGPTAGLPTVAVLSQASSE
jgi:hypothetical protein